MLQAFLVYMVYVYMAMAARESVLLLNGSNIRSWWIWHHYIAALTCIITLALPVDSHSLQSYVEGWLHWTILQALLMILQNMCAPSRAACPPLLSALRDKLRQVYRHLARLWLSMTVSYATLG